MVFLGIHEGRHESYGNDGNYKNDGSHRNYKSYENYESDGNDTITPGIPIILVISIILGVL